MRDPTPATRSEDTLTSKQAACLFKCCKHTLRRLELRGLLAAYRPIGRRKLYLRRDVEALLLGQTLDRNPSAIGLGREEAT